MNGYIARVLRPQIWVTLLVAVVLAAGISGNVHSSALAQRQLAIVAAHKKAAAKHAVLGDSTSLPVPVVDCKQVACLALTFDDGPNPITTPQVLKILEQQKVPASFFVVGSRVPGNESLLQRMNKDGDEIGNHSWSHPDLTTLKPAQIKQQIEKTQTTIKAAGVPAPTLFRPPYGDIDKKVVENVPLTFMFWNEDPRDWAADTPQQVEKAVITSAKPGGVVDMHDIYHVTANALTPIIQKLKAKHYHFVTVSQLLDLKPGQKGEFYGRP